MYASPKSPHLLRLPESFSHWMVGLFMAVLLALTGMASHAAAPAAGASISNQASASYTDGSLTPRTVTSNTVSTTVTQVASMTLTAPGAKPASPGGMVYYSHTLTNTGNGTDTFNLTTTGNTTTGFTMTTVLYFLDNGGGRPAGQPITSTGPLASNASFKFIAVGTVPNTATAGQTNTMTVTGTSVFSGAITASNADLTTVTANAVVDLTNAISVSSGYPATLTPAVPGTLATYTLTFTNNGNNTATAVEITDVIPTGMTFVAGSARWSATGSTTNIIPSAGTAPNTVAASFSGQTFVATLAQLTAGQSGTISFQVNVNAGVAPGVLNNTATTSYNNGAATATGTSNTVPFTVLQTAAVALVGEIFPGPANPGSTVSFNNVVTNNGTGVDTFNITLGASNKFPAGTTFQLFKVGGLTPLVDTNGDSILDTGPLAAGASYTVVLKATLPPNATNTGAPFSIAKTATSVFDPTKFSTGTDTLSAITNASVDLTNNIAAGGGGALGTGAGTAGDAAFVTNATNPGTTTAFTLVAKNTGPSPDSYDLAANNAFVFGGSQVLPAGWTVTFKADNSGAGAACSITGSNIINTGNVASGGSVTVCAVVTVPAGYVAGTADLYFRVLSPTSAVTDIIRDAVSVNAVRSITITPNGAGQTFPGGSYVYSHTLTNNGNVLEGNSTVSTVALQAVNNQAGFTSNLYFDFGSLSGGVPAAVSTGNGSLDASDPLLSGLGNLQAVLAAGLAPGQSVTIFDKVTAPSGAVPGSVNATTITVTTTTGTYAVAAPAPSVAVDSTTVITGNVTLEKKQSLDTACAGPGVGTIYTSGNLSAKPGECVLYEITVKNVGSADATVVVVSDSTPTFTTMRFAAVSTVGPASNPTIPNGTGAITATIGTLTPSQSAVVTFGVKIDQ